jgi:hypothetical protein
MQITIVADTGDHEPRDHHVQFLSSARHMAAEFGAAWETAPLRWVTFITLCSWAPKKCAF